MSRLQFRPEELPEQEVPKVETEKAEPKKNPRKPVKQGKPKKNGGQTAEKEKPASKGKAAEKGKAVPPEKAALPTTLHFEEDRPKPPSKLLHHTEQAVRTEVRQVLRDENEDDNVAAEAADRGQEAAESSLRTGVRATKQVREHRENRNRRESRSNPDQQQPEARRVEVKAQQKQRIKKQYARAKIQERREEQSVFSATKNFAEKAVEKVKDSVAYVRRNPKAAAVALMLFIMLTMLTNIVSSCSLILEGISSSIAGSTYPSDDADMLAAEAEYSALEAQLKNRLDHYEDDHDYNEYDFELDSIGHDPYVLISTLTALYDGAWTIDEVRGTLRMLFERQYTLTETVNTSTVTDPENPEAEPQEYRIVDVKLKNNDLSHLPCEILSEAQLARYSVYMATLGNRPDLFPGSAYIGRYGEGSYITYEIPPSALEDEAFAAIIAEAEKYLGYPYVWGGSSPSTSFDCSGFVCWVLNHSGWNVGRTTAQGLCNFCTPVRYSDAKPGDLVFFMGTYDTPEVSHVGIYVGNDMMIHCGDPIFYSNLNSAYWQEHLYCYGRLPERNA